MSLGKINLQRSKYPTGFKGEKALSPKEFSDVLGKACWLMTLSKEHRDQPMARLDATCLPAILLKQYDLVLKDDMPAAFIAWALVSPEVQQKLEKERGLINTADWRSGTELVIVDCISPFAPVEDVKKRFFASRTKTKKD